MQGCGRIGKLTIQSPVMIHFGEEPWDEVFITEGAAKAGPKIMRLMEKASYPSTAVLGVVVTLLETPSIRSIGERSAPKALQGFRAFMILIAFDPL